MGGSQREEWGGVSRERESGSLLMYVVKRGERRSQYEADQAGAAAEGEGSVEIVTVGGVSAEVLGWTGRKKNQDVGYSMAVVSGTGVLVERHNRG